MTVIPARWGISGRAELINNSSQKYATFVDIFSQTASVECNSYLGVSSSSVLLAEIDGNSTVYPGYISWDEDTEEMEFLGEVDGNHGSFVYAYEHDFGRDINTRLLQQSVEGKPNPGEILFRFIADSQYRIAESQCKGETDIPATTDAIFLLKNNGSTIGTATFLAGESLPSFDIIETSVMIGDLITFHAPSIQDDTIANLIVCFVLIFV